MYCTQYDGTSIHRIIVLSTVAKLTDRYSYVQYEYVLYKY